MHSIGYRDAILPVTPTITASAYSAGNCMGGLLTLANAFRAVASGVGTGATARLTGLTVIDKGNQKAALTILLFDRKPASTYADKATPSIGADQANIVGQIKVATADYTSNGGDSPQVAVAEEQCSILLQTNDPTAANRLNLYAVVITTGTPTPASTADLTLKFKIQQD